MRAAESRSDSRNVTRLIKVNETKVAKLYASAKETSVELYIQIIQERKAPNRGQEGKTDEVENLGRNPTKMSYGQGEEKNLCRNLKFEDSLDVIDFGLLLVVDSTSVLGSRVVSVASFVVHVFVENLLAELVRMDDRRVAVENVDLFTRVRQHKVNGKGGI